MSKQKTASLILGAFICGMVIMPISIKAAEKLETVRVETLNVINKIHNKTGKVKINDDLTVTGKSLFKKKATFKKNVDIEGDLDVDGNFSALNFRIVSSLPSDTSSLTGGDLLYNQEDNKVYVWNETSFLDLTQQDTDTNTTYTAGDNVAISEAGVISSTDTNTTYTAGSNISISGSNEISATDTNTTYTAEADTGLNLTGTEFSVDDSADFTWTGDHNHSGAITFIPGSSVAVSAATPFVFTPTIGGSGSSEGTLYYDSISNKFCYHNGTSYVQVDDSTTTCDQPE